MPSVGEKSKADLSGDRKFEQQLRALRETDLGIVENKEEREREKGRYHNREERSLLQETGFRPRKLVRSHSPLNVSSSGKSPENTGTGRKRNATTGTAVDNLMKVAMMSFMEDKKHQQLLQQQMQQQQAMLNMVTLSICRNMMPAVGRDEGTETETETGMLPMLPNKIFVNMKVSMNGKEKRHRNEDNEKEDYELNINDKFIYNFTKDSEEEE
eukprot:CAMPEP_0118693748 /NCGR_PEP_ID=MMETSP0800-20121206/12093_1 /TAXON_ID=210618 ORGANISM="Striatella unipunctata, Strain CCMP2910" /NCGR_SAMPLE_ID=MMETSP0800 /ASSEMBLY_ACC=CAM_ASM_000638 /LENGTH=212 /DNA_ID=CAMNT_0006592043 /DNA_START=750 /DNA_END=1389 /DNA_ORIENTATION=+